MGYECPYCRTVLEEEKIKEQLSSNKVIYCKDVDCQRQLKLCSHNCGCLNKATARFCQNCGKPMKLEEDSSDNLDWPQDCKDSLSSSFNASHNTICNGLIERSRFPETCEAQEIVNKESLPGLIIVKDLIVFYHPIEKSFFALSQKEEVIDNEKKSKFVKIWECPFDDYEVNRSSTPVAYNGFIYVLSANPQFLHKISLDNGSRTILTVITYNKTELRQEENRQEHFELSGTAFKEVAPLLIGHPNKLCNNTCLFYFNKENIWVINLSEESFDYDNNSVEGWLFNYDNIIEYEISRPVFMGNCLISTLLGKDYSGFVYYDMSSFPIKIDLKEIKTRDYKNDSSSRFDTYIKLDKCIFTPCVASSDSKKGFITSWFAFSKDCSAFYSVRFSGLNNIIVNKQNKNFDEKLLEKISYLKPIRLIGNNYTSILREGESFIYKDFQDKEGCCIAEQNGNQEYLIEYAIPISNDSIIIPFGANSLGIIDTTSGVLEYSRNLKSNEQIVNRPVMKNNRVYYQTNMGIVCIELSGKTRGN